MGAGNAPHRIALGQAEDGGAGPADQDACLLAGIPLRRGELGSGLLSQGDSLARTAEDATSLACGSGDFHRLRLVAGPLRLVAGWLRLVAGRLRPARGHSKRRRNAPFDSGVAGRAA